mgnify:CR=1 FL=1|tara:strand:- start:10232 stop:12334 length:2103 start_codon:yes stop_codon:yes gene_type:complete
MVPLIARFYSIIFLLVCFILALFSVHIQAGGIPTLDPVKVTAKSDNLIGTATSSSEGAVTKMQLNTRPILRPGEILEFIPGLIVTQHSSNGKANQFFLRGFNLDHGTDFLTTVGGMQVNQRSHAHGQGYTDLNFLIPELLGNIHYKKGPYSAKEGDFSSAGAAYLDYVRVLPKAIAEYTIGRFNYHSLLFAGSKKVSNGNLLFGLKLKKYDGPWDVKQNFHNFSLITRYSKGERDNGFEITAMAYKAYANATNHVAKRAIESGVIGRFGSLSPSDSISTSRYSLSSQWARKSESRITHINAYYVRSEFALNSNFTNFLDFPTAGDQIQQKEDRNTFGFNSESSWFGSFNSRKMENTVGFQMRYDNINPISLSRAQGGVPIDKVDSKGDFYSSTIRRDILNEYNISFYAENRMQWSPWLRSVIGVRNDFYHFEVNSNLEENSGKRSDNMVSPKISFIFGPWAKTEFYLNGGGGFHSNDARGITQRVDPSNANVVTQRVTPLVRTWGYEVGFRTGIIPSLQTTVSLWQLHVDSELLFVGDAGGTIPSQPSLRRGIEFTNYWRPVNWIIVDADLSLSRARFRGNSSIGNYIPGTMSRVASVGVSFDRNNWFGGIRLRHFGPRPLVKNNSQKGSSSTLVNLRAGYRFVKYLKVSLDIFNLIGSKPNDISYFYQSKLSGEEEPVADKHIHPVEPRSFRFTIQASF